jgi:hypothetical protein
MSDHADSKTQPAPTGDGNPVLPALLYDLILRRNHGMKKYGTELRANNGRDSLVDAYQEGLDLVMYLKQRLMEEATPLFTEDELAIIGSALMSWLNVGCRVSAVHSRRGRDVPASVQELEDLIAKINGIR